MSTTNFIQLAWDQQNAVETMLSGKNVFLTGPAGTGKTVVIREFLRQTLKNAVVLAPTGAAALNIGGQTIHSFFQFPIGLLTNVGYPVHPHHAAIIEATEIVIIDEISMVRSDTFWAIDAILKRFALDENRDASMGGRQIIVCGDFLQLPPFAKEAEVFKYINDQHKGIHAFKTQEWLDAEFTTCCLQNVFRQNDRAYLKILNAIRTGEIEYQTYLPIYERTIREDFGIYVGASYLDELNAKCYHPGPVPLAAPRLCATNRMAFAINQNNLEQLTGPGAIFQGIISGRFPEDDLPVDFYIEVKKGARVMLRANKFDPDSGGYEFVNGDIGTVEYYDDCNPNEPSVSVRLNNGRLVTVGRTVWTYYEYELEVDEYGKHKITQVEVGRFIQLPLMPAWAISIHKSQGLTLPLVHLVQGNGGCFCPGQLYTALSRVPSMNCLTLDRPILERDVIVDPVALQFYQKFGGDSQRHSFPIQDLF